MKAVILILLLLLLVCIVLAVLALFVTVFEDGSYILGLPLGNGYYQVWLHGCIPFQPCALP